MESFVYQNVYIHVPDVHSETIIFLSFIFPKYLLIRVMKNGHV